MQPFRLSVVNWVKVCRRNWYYHKVVAEIWGKGVEYLCAWMMLMFCKVCSSYCTCYFFVKILFGGSTSVNSTENLSKKLCMWIHGCLYLYHEVKSEVKWTWISSTNLNTQINQLMKINFRFPNLHIHFPCLPIGSPASLCIAFSTWYEIEIANIWCYFIA